MQLMLQLMSAERLAVDVVKQGVTTAHYEVALGEIDDTNAKKVGQFILGLLKFNNVHLFDDVGSAGLSGAIEMASIGNPEFDYLVYLAASAEAGRRLSRSLVTLAEKHLLLASEKGHPKALEHAKRWADKKLGLLMFIAMETERRQGKRPDERSLVVLAESLRQEAAALAGC